MIHPQKCVTFHFSSFYLFVLRTLLKDHAFHTLSATLLFLSEAIQLPSATCHINIKTWFSLPSSSSSPDQEAEDTVCLS